MGTKPAQPDLEAWEAFLTAHSVVVAALERELREEQGLPLQWYEVLLWVGRAPERRLRMRDLAASVLLTPSGLTRVVDRMEGDGLVTRRPCEDDRRGWFVELTERGLGRLRKASKTHLRGIEEHFAAHLTHRDAKVIHDALSRVVDAGRHRRSRA